MAALPAPIIIPPLLMREQSVMWRIAASTVTGGQSASGAFQLVRQDGGGLWVAEWHNVSIRTADHVRSFRAVAALAENGVMPLVVPRCDRRQFPAPIVGGSAVYSLAQVPHSDDSFFSDGTGYVGALVAAHTTAGAALRATTMVVAITAGGDLRGGEIFAIEHPNQGWRMYEIKTVVETAPDNWQITFRPPLREQIPVATPIEFDMPRCIMRLSSPDAMTLELDLRRFGSPSISFTEYFYPS